MSGNPSAVDNFFSPKYIIKEHLMLKNLRRANYGKDSYRESTRCSRTIFSGDAHEENAMSFLSLGLSASGCPEKPPFTLFWWLFSKADRFFWYFLKKGELKKAPSGAFFSKSIKKAPKSETDFQAIKEWSIFKKSPTNRNLLDSILPYNMNSYNSLVFLFICN